MKILNNINDSVESYQKLISFYHNNIVHPSSQEFKINIEFWFAANMSAVLAAILDKLNLQKVSFGFSNNNIQQILSKNGFLASFDQNISHKDPFNTTIKFQKLNIEESSYFKKYLTQDLMCNLQQNLKKMSQEVKRKIVESLYEIFLNAKTHSETNHIYTCGQFFPKKKKIEFTIVDTGIGFRERINRCFNRKLTAKQAISWAIQDKNTTKVDKTGGLGLPTLKEFIQKNNGKLQIISNDVFYQFHENIEELLFLNGEFPGTIVNLQFRTDDPSNYILSNEINLNDIF